MPLFIPLFWNNNVYPQQKKSINIPIADVDSSIEIEIITAKPIDFRFNAKYNNGVIHEQYDADSRKTEQGLSDKAVAFTVDVSRNGKRLIMLIGVW